MSRPRLLLALLASLGQAVFVARSCSDALSHSRPPTLQELRTALGPGQLQRLDLADAPRLAEDNLELRVRQDWVDTPRAALEPLFVFVDGRRVAWLPDPPEREPEQTLSWLGSRKRRERVLVLHCAEPCREAWIARDDTALRRGLAWARLREQPAQALGPLGSMVGFACLALLVAFSPAIASKTANVLRPPADSLERALERMARAPVWRWLAWAGPCAAVLLWLPLALTDRAYYADWANHLYYTARQTDALRELHHPSYFLQSSLSGPFYPYFAFYGGSLYVVAGSLSLLLGSVRAGYVAIFALGFACAYAGLLWTALLAGVRGIAAHLPALTFVSSAYYLTNAYGRGSWAETAATSMLPVVIAAGAALLFRREVGASTPAAFFFAAALLAGSHTITLVWGSLFLVLTSLALLAIFGGKPFGERSGRLLWLAELFTLAVGVNAWFLLPALAYGGATHIGGYAAHGFGSDALFLNTPANLFHPGRVVPPESGTPALYTQVPLYPLLWAACAAVAAMRSDDRVRRRALAAAVAAVVLYVTLLITGRHDVSWSLLPRILKVIQFQFRLHTYVNLSLVAVLILGLAHAARSSRPRSWTLALGAAVAVQLALAAFQIAQSPRYSPIADLERAGTRTPDTLTEAHDYRFYDHPDAVSLGEPVLARPSAEIRVDPTAVRSEQVEIELPNDGPYASNLPWSPFVETTGDVAILGRTSDGWTVLAARGASRRGVIQAASPLPVRLGRIASALSAVGAALALYRIAATCSGSRRREPPAPPG